MWMLGLVFLFIWVVALAIGLMLAAIYLVSKVVVPWLDKLVNGGDKNG